LFLAGYPMSDPRFPEACPILPMRKHFLLMWTAVFTAWLATGAVFIMGTYKSQEIDAQIISRMDLIEDGVNACRKSVKDAVR
jgi:hypothetical protein